MAARNIWYDMIIGLAFAYEKGINRPSWDEVQFRLFFNARPGISAEAMADLLKDNEKFTEICSYYKPSNHENPRFRLLRMNLQHDDGSNLYCLGEHSV